MYALIEIAGKQFRVEEGNSIKVPYIDGKIGSKVTIDKILYLDDGKNKSVGHPILKGIKIESKIESHGRGRKIVVFKFKRRKGYQKKNTHRQEYSMLKIGKLGKVAKTVSKKVATKSPEKKVALKKTVASKKATTDKKTAVTKPVTKKITTAKQKETKE